jgi:hypothetical protein
VRAKRDADEAIQTYTGLLRCARNDAVFLNSSWPDLVRPSTPFFDWRLKKAWMPGTRPGMTEQ